MRVRSLDIWHLKLPFLYPFRHKLATHAGSENLVVKVTTETGVAGYGEGIPRDFVTGETMAASLAFLRDSLTPAVLATSFDSPPALLKALRGIFRELSAARRPAAFCAVETALLDAAGRTWGLNLTDFIGPGQRESVTYSAVLPLASPERLGHFFQLVQAMKMQQVKVKVGEAEDLAVLAEIRKELGWEVDLRVDANAAWSASEAVQRLKEMLPYKISAVEQPVPKEDFLGLKKVSQALPIPVIADESLCSEGDAARLIELQACRMFNLRLSKCGGLGAAGRIQQMAKAAGVSCQLGCHVGETSILAAAGRHFTLAGEDLVYVEGSFAPFILQTDPVRRPVVFKGEGRGLPLPGPGLGVEVLEGTLQELVVLHVCLP